MDRKSQKAMWVKINHGNVNQTEVDDIILTQENHGDFYRRVLSPNTQNFEKRMKRGSFTIHHALNSKGFVERIGREAVNDYFSKFGGVPYGLTADTKKKVGQELIETMVQRARENVHSDKIMSTPKGHALMARDKIKTVQEHENIAHGMRGLR